MKYLIQLNQIRAIKTFKALKLFPVLDEVGRINALDQSFQLDTRVFIQGIEGVLVLVKLNDGFDHPTHAQYYYILIISYSQSSFNIYI